MEVAVVSVQLIGTTYHISFLTGPFKTDHGALPYCPPQVFRSSQSR